MADVAQKKKNDDLEMNTFGLEPQQYTCHYCNAKVMTSVEYEANVVTYIACFLIFLVFNVYSLIIIPFLIPLTKSAVHKCTNCFNRVGAKNCMGIPFWKDKVISFQVGNFAVVLSRVYVAAIVLIIGIIGYVSLVTYIHKTVYIYPYTWEEYKTDCGREALLKSPEGVMNKFRSTYSHKGVEWEGYVVKIDQSSDRWFASPHSAAIQVKMENSDSEKYPDLYLTFSEEYFQEFRSVLATLDRGDPIKFVAVLIAAANENQLHHMHATQLEKLEKPKMNVDEIFQNLRTSPLQLHDHHHHGHGHGQPTKIKFKTVKPQEGEIAEQNKATAEAA
eukprot:CAMPEP_0114995796 /NCGR_PEP_ID=MMETSP0216-20121206/13938_1 /TAXON_ID=223996 /ORGANISM="Protocruzia adherens, Strain Boccale" /LENGTH=331 /DNA_ID=CAMNT_0002359897 /DNA_START=60 /DNA_END=1055 /DNA_ORIENTATION=+